MSRPLNVDFWLRIFAETDCLLSLAKSSADMDEPKVRPVVVQSDSAYIDFEDLRHPCMSLRTDFIANDVKLGGAVARQVLLTGPSELVLLLDGDQSSRLKRSICVPDTAGKSTMMRSTAMGIILCQLGCFVPAVKATYVPCLIKSRSTWVNQSLAT
jgi:DNA mismatch repair protein MSH6